MTDKPTNPMAPNQLGHPADRGQHKSSMGKGPTSRTARLSMQGTPAPSLYAKDLEFPADGPGRVIVRLERLMGSDQIRITDTKYMAILLQRLQEEEEITLQKRTWERRKAEHNRFRQLVIDGYTEPTQAMQDLYKHPVFRVNRILNRLNRLNSNATPAANLPPIIPVDPFKSDDTGRVFKSYPGHYALAHKSGSRGIARVMKPLPVSPGLGQYSPKQVEKVPNLEKGAEIALGPQTEYDISGGNVTKIAQTEFNSKGTESINEDPFTASSRDTSADINEERSGDPTIKIGKQNVVDDEAETYGTKTLSLQEIQRKYKVATNADLGSEWKPYRSPIVETLFEDEQRGVWDLYEMGKDIVSMYDRQHQTTDDYVESLLKSKKSEKTQGLRSPASKNDDNGEWREQNDGTGNLDDEIPPLTEMEEDYADEQEEAESDNEVSFEPLFDEEPANLEAPPTWENFEDEMWNEKLDDRHSSIPQEENDVLEVEE